MQTLNVHGNQRGRDRRKGNVCHHLLFWVLKIKSYEAEQGKGREEDVNKERRETRSDMSSSFRYHGLQPEHVPHGDVSDRLLYTHTRCESLLRLCSKCRLSYSLLNTNHFFQDGILFGIVGAYDWDGGVLKQGTNGVIVPPREAFESEFPLELKNHAAYLGTTISKASIF